MHLAIEAMRQGDNITPHFKAGFAKWAELLKDIRTQKLAELAEVLSEAQVDYFERQCGGRSLGQEVMAWTAIAYYFDTEEGGFGDDVEVARKVYDALQLSQVSIDVKVHTERAAITYGLFDDLEEAEFDA